MKSCICPALIIKERLTPPLGEVEPLRFNFPRYEGSTSSTLFWFYLITIAIIIELSIHLFMNY